MKAISLMLHFVVRNVAIKRRTANDTLCRQHAQGLMNRLVHVLMLGLSTFLIGAVVFQVKSQQAEVIRILESKSIQYELIDISVGGELRDEMRSKAGNPTAVPPQLFNEDQYCGVSCTPM